MNKLEQEREKRSPQMSWFIVLIYGIIGSFSIHEQKT